MDRLTVLFLMCLVAMTSLAQTADLEVDYTMHTRFPDGYERNREYRLLANANMSKFYNPVSEEIDSMTSTPEGRAAFKEMQRKALTAMIEQGAIDTDKLPGKKETVYVMKSSRDSLVTVYDVLSDEQVYYAEPFSELIWTVGDSTKSVLGYECIQAESDYHGRHWTAWFTPEIPIYDGPWKFRGLPGLILEVVCDDGKYSFIAEGIVHTDRIITGIYGADGYEKCDRKDILRARRAMADNPAGALNAKGLSFGVRISQEGSRNQDSDDFIETDYR